MLKSTKSMKTRRVEEYFKFTPECRLFASYPIS
jgi:hypothetical protein